MDPAQKFLFGTFPRRVGTPNQWIVHSENEMDSVIDLCEGERNLYSTISRYDYTDRLNPLTDKISIDLDSPMKEAAFPSTDRDNERVMMMRDDSELADEILGPVVEDSRKIAQYADENDIPIMGVFSGFGMHIHMMYEETSHAREYLATTVRRLLDILDLNTLDIQLIGDVERILRIPNVRRVHVDSERGESIDEDTHVSACNLYTVPIEMREMKDLTVHDLLQWSNEPRQIQLPDGERPSMQVYDDYLESRASIRGQVEVETDVENYDRKGLLELLKNLLQMPCLYERIIQPNPHHFVRFNSAVVLFNAGFEPGEVEDMFMSLGWVDGDRGKTRKFLKQIYSHGYSDMSCQSMMAQGLCVRSENPEECRTYGWSGGKCEWID